ncbi:hypothetical protein ACP4OV_028735 [Aristida adscensionis]
MTNEQVQAKRGLAQRIKEKKGDTLNKASIAMENPSFVPELVLDKPTLKSPEPPAPEVYWSCASLKASEFLNFEITGRPFIPMSNSGHDVGLDHQDASGAKKSRRLCNKDPFMEVEDKNGSNSISQPGVTNTESIKTDYMTGASTPSQPHANNDGDDDGVIFEDDDEEEEGYLFAGQDEDIEEDAQMDDANLESSYVPNMNDPYDKVYSNMPQDTHNLEPVQNCGYCNAKKFQYEPEGFCCRGGKIQLVEPETPPELMRLWSSADADAKHFRENVRFFNGHFSFTSLYCNLDSKTTDTRNGGIYTFHAHGQMYHNIRSFGRDGTEPNHLELYFYDDDPSLKHRFHKCRQEQFDKDREVIKGLARILRGNPYAGNLRSLGQVDDLEDCRVTFNLDQRLDQRTYNAPLTSEVAAIWIEGVRYAVSELGWHSDIPKVGVDIRKVLAAREKKKSAGNISTEDPGSPGNKCVSVRDYYCYKFQMRPGIFNPILHGKCLFQQFAVDSYIKIESSRLDYIRHNQRDLRAELYQGLVDALHAGEGRSDKVGKRTMLSTSFIGGPRDMRRRYMDATALVRKYGKPDIFLTMTCNPNWDEIKRELYPGQISQDRPDLVVRVFRAKLEELKKRLLQYDILGKVRAYVYVVEFQKRGLPHAHFLLIMQNKYKLTCPEQYDLLISAEIPDKKKYPELHKMVIKHMMHGPCGALNRNCPCCIGRQSCKNNYPRAYSETTIQGKDSYPIYRRRKDGKKENVRNAQLDNAWVVPYNPYLLRLFNCHINVEACGSIKAVKYLFKYIYKGHDRASIAVREAGKVDDHENIDEIKQYRDANYACTNNDLDIINRIKKIPADPGREEVVLIGDAVVHRYGMECLFNKEEFLNDEVINAYINLLRTQEHLLQRSDGTVYLENSIISFLMKRDGDDCVNMEEMYGKIGGSAIKQGAIIHKSRHVVINAYINLLRTQEHLLQRSDRTVHLENSIISFLMKRDGDDCVNMEEMYGKIGGSAIKQRVLSYINHDMVFLPINIKDKHWYLAVINARQCEIQVLDSCGDMFDRKDLITTLKGLQKQINMVSQHIEFKDHEWTNLQVTSWPIREIEFDQEMQEDGSSCGLFLLNFAEYWTGIMLSDNITQKDMTEFRTKLAAILLSSKFNERKGSPLFDNKDEMDGEPSEVIMLRSAPDAFKSTDNSNKRKREFVYERDDEFEYPSELDAILDSTPSTHTMTLDSNKLTMTPSSIDGDIDKFLFHGLPIIDMPLSRDNMIDVVCDYIITINDPELLEKEWVRSFQPYKITIKVKQLHASLDLHKDMPEECFNIAVRLLARAQLKKLQSDGTIMGSKHYMDLKFCNLSDLNRDPKFRKRINWKDMSTTLEGWHYVQYDVSQCRYTLMPWVQCGNYMLFVLDDVQKQLIVLDPNPLPLWPLEIPCKRYFYRMHGIAINYGNAMRVFHWPPCSTNDGSLEQWSRTQFCMEDSQLRKNLLIDLLTYEGNSYRFAIPENIRHYLTRIIDTQI